MWLFWKAHGKVVGGAVFSVGLILVVIAGAELFTGNVIMTVGAVTRLYSFRKLLKNWVFVYIGNMAGAAILYISCVPGRFSGPAGRWIFRCN